MNNSTDIIPIKFCDYSDAELMNVIEHLYGNMRNLANAVENSRPDIAQALDSIIDHPTIIGDVGIQHVPTAGMINDSVIVNVDLMNNKMAILDLDGNTIEETPLLNSQHTEKKLKKMIRRPK